MALRNHFAYAPRWICLARVENSFALPEILDVPDAVNHVPWPDGEALSCRDHASVLREWDARYGVEVSYLGTGALLLSIDSPPVDPIEVARVAIEQYAYCPDLEQVLGGIEQVAARQVSSPQWFFWWD